MPTLFMPIGLPGSGKTSWVRQISENRVVISSDDILEKNAAINNTTYDDEFKNADWKTIRKQMSELMQYAIDNDLDVIIDRTNMSVKNRRSVLSRFPNYTKVAIVFSLPDNVLMERLRVRAETTGKTIPQHVIDDMAKRYESPSKLEFDHIITSVISRNLRNLLNRTG